jgi:hypothetical protein
MRRLALLAICAFTLCVPVAARAATGTVEGTVTPIAWAPEVEVCLVEPHPSVDCTAPAADGTYALSAVPTESSRIEFVPSFRSRLLTQYYDHKATLAEATPITIPSSAIPLKGIDADLIEGAAIAGTVSAAGGGALAEVEVCALPAGSTGVTACAETDAFGVYELHSLPADTYTVRFTGTGDSRGYEQAYFPGGSAAAPTPITLAAGETAAGIDVALVPGARIAGVVTDAANGGPLAGIAVCLFAAAGPTPSRCAESSAAGEYAFEGLPAGDYQIGFSPAPAELGGFEVIGLNDGFETQYYDRVPSRLEARTISLPASATVAGIDAALSGLPAPSPEPPPPTVTAPLVAAPTPVAVPTPKAAACKKPLRKRKVKGKERCVRKPRKHKKHKAHKRGHRGAHKDHRHSHGQAHRKRRPAA